MTAANIVTGIRLVLFAFFVVAAHEREVGLAAGLFAVAWGLDVVDGWLARRLKQASRFGFLFDKAVDRIVILGGCLVLLMEGLIPEPAILLLTKDIVMLPALTVWIKTKKQLEIIRWPGKIVTTLQGGAILWLLLGLPNELAVIFLVAAIGAIVGGRYLYKVMYGLED
jgi:CDP-diacylglycerol--glycerol-3-phosphate 3-phosphatidyltransferase